VRSCESDHDRAPGQASVPDIGYSHRVQIRVAVKEAGLDGKILEIMDREALRALPAVQSKQREAEAGLARHRAKLKAKFGDLPRLHSFSVVAVGFERLVFSPSE